MKKLLAISAALVLTTGTAFAQTKIKYALGDVIGIDDLILLVASERAKKRGVEVEVTSFKNEEIATQAVISPTPTITWPATKTAADVAPEIRLRP